MQLIHLAQLVFLTSSAYAAPHRRCHAKSQPSTGGDVGSYGQSSNDQGSGWKSTQGSSNSESVTIGYGGQWSNASPTVSSSTWNGFHSTYSRQIYWNNTAQTTSPSYYPTSSSAWSSPPQASCSNDDILLKLCEPAINDAARSICSALLQTTVTSIVPGVSTILVDVTSALEAVHATSTVDLTITGTVTTTATSFLPDVTTVITSSAATVENPTPIKRNVLPSLPAALTNIAPSQLSSACSCLVGSSIQPTTVTATAVATVTNANTVTASGSTIFDAATSTIADAVTDTITTTPPASTVTSIAISEVPTYTIPDCTPAPGETRGALRIEGATDTIFEGFVCSGPLNVTTPSGGAHLCDGTNDGANPTPGGTLTTMLQTIEDEYGISFDGTFDSSFDDFFITSIGDSTQTSTQFWGLLQNLAFTSAGGCQTEYTTSDQNLWAFDAFDKAYFLSLAVDKTSVNVGGTVVATVTGTNGSGGSFSAVSGATVGGVATGADGTASITFNTAGVFRLKATRSDSLRSNAQYVIVN